MSLLTLTTLISEANPVDGKTDTKPVSTGNLGNKTHFAIAEIAAKFANLSVRFSALCLLRQTLEPLTIYDKTDTKMIPNPTNLQNFANEGSPLGRSFSPVTFAAFSEAGD